MTSLITIMVGVFQLLVAIAEVVVLIWILRDKDENE